MPEVDRNVLNYGSIHLPGVGSLILDAKLQRLHVLTPLSMNLTLSPMDRQTNIALVDIIPSGSLSNLFHDQ